MSGAGPAHEHHTHEHHPHEHHPHEHHPHEHGGHEHGEHEHGGHASAHSAAALVAHTHDLHAPEPGTPEHDASEHRGEITHRPSMVAAPERQYEFAPFETGLTVLYRALSGFAGELVAYDDDTDPARLPESVHALHLPAHAPIDEHHGSTRADWYRVAVTHRALHHLMGTFELDLVRPEPLFERLRPDPAGTTGATAFERFTGLFADPALAVELFVILEDLRIDTAVRRRLPGLAEPFRLACHEALHDRPPLSMLTARDAVAEALVQFSLGAAGVQAPTALLEPIAQLATVARRLLDPAASAESSAEATIRLYRVLMSLPERAVHRAARAVAFDDLPDVALPGDTTLGDLLDEPTDARVTFHPVPYRDAPGGRYVTGDRESGLPLEQAVLRMAASDDERGEEQDAGDGRPTPSRPDDAGTSPDDTSSRTASGAPLPVPSELDLGEHDASGGRLFASAPHEYVYPEWDAVTGRYREGWCLVRVARAPAADTLRGHRTAMARHGHLLPGLVAALERVQPAGRDIVLRQPHGDDLDLDACVEAMADLRAGLEPSDRVFASTQDRTRDVAVAFAIDLSASTAESLPPDPAEPGLHRSTLDVQRDAVGLLVEALERVGDAYGIFGFSGSGRTDVRLTVVKDVEERRSPVTRRRLQALVPDHTTRMGPAIRHLAARLAAVDAATKILLVISDGRPYDIDYGQQYGESATVGYALADTGRALEEARRAGVRPYLVTVDSGGADYLSRICDPREYHVIGDARELPRSLAELYVVARGEALRRRVPAPV